MKRFPALLLCGALALTGCGGSNTSSPAPASVDSVALSATDVQRVLAQGVAEASARGLAAPVAVTDRVGNVLAVYQMPGASSTVDIDSGMGVHAGEPRHHPGAPGNPEKSEAGGETTEGDPGPQSQLCLPQFHQGRVSPGGRRICPGPGPEAHGGSGRVHSGICHELANPGGYLPGPGDYAGADDPGQPHHRPAGPGGGGLHRQVRPGYRDFL